MGSRALAPEAAETAAQKEQQATPKTQMQQNTVNSSVLWLGSRARARRPENQREKSKDRAAREPATAKAKRTEQQPNAQRSSFWRYLQRFVERGPCLAPKCAKMSLALIPPILLKNSASCIRRLFQTLTMSATWPKLCIYAMFCEAQARAGDASRI